MAKYRWKPTLKILQNIKQLILAISLGVFVESHVSTSGKISQSVFILRRTVRHLVLDIDTSSFSKMESPFRDHFYIVLFKNSI